MSKKSRKNRIKNHLKKVGLAMLTLTFINNPVSAVEPIDPD